MATPFICKYILAAVAVSSLAACSSGTPSAEPSETVSPSPTSTETASGGVTECVNDAQGYAVSYPDGWFTASTHPENECRWFDREPLVVDEGSEPPPLDLEVIAEQRTFQEVTDAIGADDSGEELLTREETTIGGHEALEFETRSTGEGQLPADARTYGYVLDVEGRTFLVLTQLIPPDAPPYEENQAELAAVAASIRVL